MNYYNPYTGSGKKRFVRRITAVIVSVVIITGATIVFGNYLKRKADSTAEGNYGGIGREDISPETEAPVIIPPSEGGTGTSESVKGLCVPLGAAPDAESHEETFEERLSAAATGNSGVLIPLTGEDGYLLYNSKRASESARVPENPVLPTMEDLTNAVSLAKAKGLRATALITAGVVLDSDTDTDTAITADQRIAADAAEAGFDEIVVVSLVRSPDDISGENSHVILRYVNQLKEVAGDAQIGLSLPASVYEDATLSPRIELLASGASFLTMELTEEQSTEEYMTYICENLAGTLSVYNMRILMAPANTAVGEKITEKLASVGHENYLYTGVPAEPPQAEPDETDADDPADTVGTRDGDGE